MGVPSDPPRTPPFIDNVSTQDTLGFLAATAHVGRTAWRPATAPWHRGRAGRSAVSGEAPREPGCGALATRRDFRTLGPRTHQAHLAAQHVQRLRQFVEAQAPQHAAQRRRAPVRMRRPHGAGGIFRIHRHGAELHQFEDAAAAAQAALAVEHRPAVAELHCQRHGDRDQQPERREQHPGDTQRRQVERAFVRRAATRRSVGARRGRACPVPFAGACVAEGGATTYMVRPAFATV